MRTLITLSLLLTFVLPLSCKTVRVLKPVVSGSFYPAGHRELTIMIDKYLKLAESDVKKTKDPVFGLISPHAGYIYSGAVAAYGYSLIRNKPCRTVIVIGPSHFVSFDGGSIFPDGYWESPLGKVKVDSETASKIMQACPFIKFRPEAFAKEHSLETQLPFLQSALRDFMVIPIMLSSFGPKEHEELSKCLAELISNEPDEFLIIASSDMSHYHSYKKACAMDKGTLDHILALDDKQLLYNLLSRKSELCGMSPVITLMQTASRLKGEAHLLRYANSGDVSRDKSRVVGYSSIAFTIPEKKAGLTEKEQETLLTLARKTLVTHVKDGKVPEAEGYSGNLADKWGVFVTLNKSGTLRGCLGYIKGVKRLWESVVEMTVKAATKDPRFKPVTKEELSAIKIEISVLTPLKLIKDPMSIRVGKHGLLISKGWSSGLLLPQVPVENNWTREEFLEKTCEKAGLPAQAWKDKATEIYTFTAQVFSE